MASAQHVQIKWRDNVIDLGLTTSLRDYNGVLRSFQPNDQNTQLQLKRNSNVLTAKTNIWTTSGRHVRTTKRLKLKLAGENVTVVRGKRARPINYIVP